MSRFLLFVLFAALGVSSASAQTFSSPSRLLVLDSGKAELAPRVHAKNQMVYASWVQAKQASTGDIFFATSTDGGLTFTTAVPVTTSGGVPAGLQRSGEFAIDNKGYIHMVWTEMRFDDQTDVFYKRSTDNGQTWSMVADISRDDRKAIQDFPAIAADSLGNVYVAWIDNRDRTNGLTEYDQLYFCRSTDNGATWETPMRADRPANNEGGSCECCRLSVQASPEGKVFIAFRGNISHVRDIWVARSNDKGVTWDETIRVQTKLWVIHACPATGPMTTLDKAGNLHVVYRMVDGTKTQVYYNILPAGASKTFNQFALTPSAAVNYPDVHTTSDGVVYVAYQVGNDGIQYRRTTNGGATWEPMQWASQSTSREEFAIFATIGDSLALLWQDNGRDRGEIMIAKTEDKTQGVLPVIADLAREIGNDTVIVTWRNTAPGGMAWYEIATEDGVTISLDTVVRLPRELADRSNVTVTPINNVGRGESLSLEQLSVTMSTEADAGVYPNPVASGEIVVLPVVVDKSLEWSILDITGKPVSQATSYRTYVSYKTHTSHQLTLPELPEGIYYLTNTDSQQSYKIVVRK